MFLLQLFRGLCKTGRVVLVLFSVLKWRVVIVAKKGLQWQNLLRCDNWLVAGTSEPNMVGFCDLIEVGIGPLSKKMAIKDFLIP